MAEIWRRVSPSAQPYVHDLGREGEAARVRLDRWRALMRDRAMDFAPVGDVSRFEGAIAGRAFDGGVLARWTLSEQVLVRTPLLAKTLDDEYVFVNAVVNGSGVHQQGDASFHLNAGDFTVVEAYKPYESIFTSTSTRGFLHIKKSALRQRLGGRADLAFGHYRDHSPLQRLAFHFLRNLTKLAHHAEVADLAALSNQALDVIAMLVNERHPGSIAPSTHRAAMLTRIKAQIAANLRDGNYNLELAAMRLGITPRYVNALLAEDGWSFSRLLLEKRLLAARRDIVDPFNVNRRISEIAFDWGFGNVSHFSRVFRARFQMSPSDMRYASLMVAA